MPAAGSCPVKGIPQKRGKKEMYELKNREIIKRLIALNFSTVVRIPAKKIKTGRVSAILRYA